LVGSDQTDATGRRRRAPRRRGVPPRRTLPSTGGPSASLRSGLGSHRSRLASSMSDTGSGYSPGLKGVVAGETSLAMIDGDKGRLLYRGYPIGELVERGTYAQVAERSEERRVGKECRWQGATQRDKARV